MSSYDLMRASMLQLGHVSLHYIDYPIDILIMIKHLAGRDSQHRHHRQQLDWFSTTHSNLDDNKSTYFNNNNNDNNNTYSSKSELIGFSSLVLFLLPNLLLASFSTLYNLSRLSCTHLVMFAVLFLLNLEPLACSILYVALAAHKNQNKHRNRNTSKNHHHHHSHRHRLIDVELHAASFNLLISTCFRAFFVNYSLSILLALHEYRRRFVLVNSSTDSTAYLINIEVIKIGVSVCKLAIYSSRFVLFFLKHEFKLKEERSGNDSSTIRLSSILASSSLSFYAIRLPAALLFSLARISLLVFALATFSKRVLIVCAGLVTFLVFKLLLVDVVYHCVYFSCKSRCNKQQHVRQTAKFNSLVLFWSVFMSLLKQAAYMGSDYIEMAFVGLETVCVYAYVCYLARLNLIDTLVFVASTVCVLVVFVSMLIEFAHLKYLTRRFQLKNNNNNINNERDKTGAHSGGGDDGGGVLFLEMMRTWIGEKSRESSPVVLSTPTAVQAAAENLSLVAMNVQS